MDKVQTETDTQTRLTSLADSISKLKSEKSRIEGQVESLEKQQVAVENRCRALGVEPAELDKMIQMRSDTLYSKLQSMEQAVRDIELRRDQVQRVRNPSREASSN